MRAALPNEHSVVTDGQPLALPLEPPNGTENEVLAAGSAFSLQASGDDVIDWASQATPESSAITVAAGTGHKLVYVSGTWYVVY